jgi:hypothetical protein
MPHVVEHLLLRPTRTVAHVPPHAPLTAEALHARVVHLMGRLRRACGGELNGRLVALAAPATNAYVPLVPPVVAPPHCGCGGAASRQLCIHLTVPAARRPPAPGGERVGVVSSQPHQTLPTGAFWRRCSR